MDKTGPTVVASLLEFCIRTETKQAFILQHSAEKSICNSADAKHDNCD